MNLEEGGGQNAKGETEHWTVVQVARVEQGVVRHLNKKQNDARKKITNILIDMIRTC